MSTLIVEVCAVEEIAPIPNADRIERVRVKNWWCIAGKGHYKVGDKAVYVPPDSVLPEAWPSGGGSPNTAATPRTSAANGRRAFGSEPPSSVACPSFGTIQDPDDKEWDGRAGRAGALRHHQVRAARQVCGRRRRPADDPPSTLHQHRAVRQLPRRLRGRRGGRRHREDPRDELPRGLGERVRRRDGQPDWEFMAGSHNNRRKEFNDKGVRSLYWLPFKVEFEDDRVQDPCRDHARPGRFHEEAKFSVIVFGEIFGAGVQDMQYGQKGKSFRIFDIAVDGTYLDWDAEADQLRRGKDPRASRTGPGPVPGAVLRAEDGRTGGRADHDLQGRRHQRAVQGPRGVVIKPVKERFECPTRRPRVLKYVSADYHARKNKMTRARKSSSLLLAAHFDQRAGHRSIRPLHLHLLGPEQHGREREEVQ
jgi:hypothetical protein